MEVFVERLDRSKTFTIEAQNQDHDAAAAATAARSSTLIFNDARQKFEWIPHEIQLSIQVPELITIKQFLLDTDKSRDTVGDLKLRIRQVIDIRYHLTASNEFKLMFCGFTLRDDDETLEAAGLYDQSQVIVEMVPPLPQHRYLDQFK